MQMNAAMRFYSLLTVGLKGTGRLDFVRHLGLRITIDDADGQRDTLGYGTWDFVFDTVK